MFYYLGLIISDIIRNKKDFENKFFYFLIILLKLF